MKNWHFLLFFHLYSLCTFAQDQLGLRVNEAGIIKILKMATEYNQSSTISRSFIIPQSSYKLSIPAKTLSTNAIVKVVSELSDLDFNKDLEFYLNTSDIKMDGDVDLKSLKVTIVNSTSKWFDVKVSLQIPKINLKGDNISLCEKLLSNKEKCSNGLQTSISQFNISSKNRPIVVNIVLRINTADKVVRATVRSTNSNLASSTSPDLDISFSKVEVPPIAIIINGQETVLDTSRLKGEILKRKAFLASKLLSFTANFFANDLVGMINSYLVNETIVKSYQIYKKDYEVSFDEYLNSGLNVAQIDATYVRKDLLIFREGPLNPVNLMINEISNLIHSAQVDIGIKKITTPSNKDLELTGLINLVLNGNQIKVKSTIGNSEKKLPVLNLNQYRKHDFTMALSEPLINGALDLANSTNLFQEIFESISSVKGFYVRNLKIHFADNYSLVGVVNAKVDLNKIASDSPYEWIKNKIGAWLERNNNESIIYFPIEVRIIPEFTKLSSGGAGISLKIESPFKTTDLPNRYNYPSNIPAMTEVVKEAVLKELEESIGPYTNKTYAIDLGKFLNQGGFEFKPMDIAFDQAAYLVLGVDLIKVNRSNTVNLLK